MTRKLKISLLALGALGLFLTCSLIQPPSRHLSDSTAWINDALATPSNRTNAVAFFESLTQLRQTGTNALPELLEMLAAEDSVLTEAKEKINSIGIIQIGGFITAKEKRSRAIKGFMVLGEIAIPAIPDLTNMIARGEAAEAAVDALCAIRNEAVVGALTNTLRSNKDEKLRRYALRAVAEAGFNERDFNQIFFAALEDPVPGIRMNALSYLFMSQMPNPDPDVQRHISRHLSSESNADVRAFATNLMARIAEFPKTNHIGESAQTNGSKMQLSTGEKSYP